MGRRPRPYRVPDGGWRFTVAGRKYWRSTEADAWAVISKLTSETRQTAPPLSIIGLIDHWKAVAGNPHANEMLDEFEGWAVDHLRTFEDVDDETLNLFARHCKTRESKRGGLLSRETVRKKVRYASVVLRYAHSKGWVDRMPVVPRLPKPPPTPKALRPLELAELFEDLNKSTKTRNAVKLIRFILEVGCRPGEARTLKWANVQWEQRAIVLGSHKTDAGGDARIIPLSATAIEILKSCKHSGAYVFVSHRGRPYTRDGFAAILQRRGVSPYRLRHTWCQNATDRGVDDRTIRAIMGHKTSSMLQMYRAISDSAVHAAVAQLDGLSRVGFHGPRPTRKRGRASRRRAAGTSQSSTVRSGKTAGVPEDRAAPNESRRDARGRKRKTG